MRTVTCEPCQKSVELNEYGLPPAGWITIQTQAPSAPRPVDCCCVACAVRHLAEKVDG